MNELYVNKANIANEKAIWWELKTKTPNWKTFKVSKSEAVEERREKKRQRKSGKLHLLNVTVIECVENSVNINIVMVLGKQNILGGKKIDAVARDYEFAL